MSTVSVSVVEEWINTDTSNTLFYVKIWKPLKTVATVLALHGAGEHISRYDEIFAHFAQHGIKVFGFDQRGYGKTAQRTKSQGECKPIDILLQDILYFSREAKQVGIKHFVYGHSMGGGIALDFAIKYPYEIDGVIASAPGIVQGIDIRPNIIEKVLVKAVKRFWPSFIGKTRINKRTMMRDVEKKKEHERDELYHYRMSVGYAYDLIQLGPRLLKTAKELQVPLLICHGSADKMTCPIGSLEFFDKVKVEDKKYVDYLGFYHELHNEELQDRQRLFKDYVDWILAHQ